MVTVVAVLAVVVEVVTMVVVVVAVVVVLTITNHHHHDHHTTTPPGPLQGRRDPLARPAHGREGAPVPTGLLSFFFFLNKGLGVGVGPRFIFYVF